MRGHVNDRLLRGFTFLAKRSELHRFWIEVKGIEHMTRRIGHRGDFSDLLDGLLFRWLVVIWLNDCWRLWLNYALVDRFFSNGFLHWIRDLGRR